MKKSARALFVIGILVLPGVQTSTKGLTPQNEEGHQRVDSQEKVSPHEQALRQRAFYIADAMTVSTEVEDKLQAAHMRADFAALLCLYGERGKGVDVIRNGIRDAVTLLLLQDDSHSDDYNVKRLELPIRLAQLMNDCEQSSQFSIADDIARIELERKDSEPSVGKEPDVVSDQLWGSKPSARRQMAADILARAAHEKAADRKLAEAEKLLSRSLDFCVRSLVTVLGELSEKGGAEAAARLFFKAVEQVRAKPSGSELSALSSVIFWHLRSKGSSGQDSGGASGDPDRYLQAYLDAVLALVRDVNSSLAGKSVHTVRLVKESLSFFTRKVSRHPSGGR